MAKRKSKTSTIGIVFMVAIILCFAAAVTGLFLNWLQVSKGSIAIFHGLFDFNSDTVLSLAVHDNALPTVIMVTAIASLVTSLGNTLCSVVSVLLGKKTKKANLLIAVLSIVLAVATLIMFIVLCSQLTTEIAKYSLAIGSILLPIGVLGASILSLVTIKK